MAAAPIRYHLDGADCISWMSETWAEFARSNGANEIAGGIEGRPLWDFVAGLETRHLYEILFARVRGTGRSIVLPFRCDSPDLRRFMELEVSFLAGDALQVTASLVREEPRSPVPLLDALIPRTSETISLCSFCKRVLLEPDSWVEVEQGVMALDLFGQTELPRLTHGVCPDCEARFRALVEPGDTRN